MTWAGRVARPAMIAPFLLALAIVGAVTLVPRAAAAPEEVHVSLLQASVSDPLVNVLVGDTVHWVNASFRDHTVTSRDGLFDSGPFGPGRTFSYVFGAAGKFAYACKIHPSVTGEVDAYPVLLSGPKQADTGSSVSLRGRAVPGSGAVTVEEDGGSGFHPVAGAVPGGDGTFTVSVTLPGAASYRAVTAAGSSPPLRIELLPAQSLVLRARVRRGIARLTVSSLRPQPGARVMVQGFLRERFGWWPLARGRLDSKARARFALRRKSARRLRAVLTKPEGWTPLAVSNVVRLPRWR